MALSQQFPAPRGLTPSVRVEQPVEPGQPRLFWDGKARAWVTDPAARVAAWPDLTLEGVYRIELPTVTTATWPDKVYWLAATDPAGALIQLWPVSMTGGDDGASPDPSADLTLPDGRKLHLWGAYIKGA